MAGCLKRIYKNEGGWVLNATFSRIMFLLHLVLTVWVTKTAHQNTVWYNMLFVLIYFAYDGFWILVKNKKYSKYQDQYTFAVYIVTVATGIYFTELRFYDDNRNFKKAGSGTSYYSKPWVEQRIKRRNYYTPNGKVYCNMFGYLCNNFTSFVTAVEQLTPCVLIFSRWLMPKGKMSRQEFSNMLLVLLGGAADIFEFMDVLLYKEVKENEELIQIVIILWAISLIQFLVETPSNEKVDSTLKQYFVEARTKWMDPSAFSKGSRIQKDAARHIRAINSLEAALRGKREVIFEMVLIIVNVILQDGPYFIFRVYVFVKCNLITASHIFFTLKNGLVIVLQLYRVLVLLHRMWEHRQHRLSAKRNITKFESKMKDDSVRTEAVIDRQIEEEDDKLNHDIFRFPPAPLALLDEEDDILY